ncbi:MAG: SDR family NAD(P)-dependent oxidoreductase [Phycisphaerales bacterium]
MSASLKDRIAVVTGASAGIGEAIVRELVGAGCPVVMNARRRERLEALRAELGEEDVDFVAGDCADEGVIHRLLDVAKDRFGGGKGKLAPKRDADLIVINAGRGLGGTALTSDERQWDELIRTNITAAARLIRAGAKRLLAAMPETDIRHDGPWLSRPRDIVILGSVVGRHVSPFSSFYSCTKAAVQTLAEGTRRELGPKGIRVTLIEPAFVTSEFQAVAGYSPEWYEQMVQKFGPMLAPADIARTIAFVTAQPAHVHLSDVLIRPTRQEYP